LYEAFSPASVEEGEDPPPQETNTAAALISAHLKTRIWGLSFAITARIDN
jgi:hypothetical protein